MSRERPESLQEARHWRAVEVLERAMASPTFRRDLDYAIEAIARGEKGIPLKELQEEIRRREGA